MTTRFTIERAENGGYIVFTDDIKRGYANYPAAALSNANALLEWLRDGDKSPIRKDVRPTTAAEVMAYIRREHPECIR